MGGIYQMSRSCLLSSSGDPFILLLVLKLFQERWYGEVDEFFVNINHPSKLFPQEVENELLGRLASDKKITFIYHHNGLGNGAPITEMLHICQRDNIMLLEDDGFIFSPGVVNDCFSLIESGETDIVGSPRGSCGMEIWEESKKKYNLDYSGYGDVGPNWWPNFFFCKRADLLRTDMNFASKEFKAGDYYKELDHTFKETQYGDTFVWTCMQLRAMGLRSKSVPQHKADPYEIQNKELHEQNWHPSEQPFSWIHGGSLSAGWGGYLSGIIPQGQDDSSKREMESRCAFWSIASEVTEGFTEFKLKYQQGIIQLIANYGLDAGNVQKKITIYKQLMKL